MAGLERSNSVVRGAVAVAAVTAVVVAALVTAASRPPSAAAFSCTKLWSATTSGLWADGANWTNGTPPTASDDVCIAGLSTLTVTVDNAFSAHSLHVGGSAGTQTVLVVGNCSNGASLALAADSDITVNGALTLDSTCNSSATLLSTKAAPQLVNSGTITSAATSGGARSLEMTVANFGTLVVDQTLGAVVKRSFTNDGAIDLAAGQQLKWGSGPFTLDAGAITAAAGAKVSGSGLFTQGNGTATTNAISRTGSIAYTGAGASSIIATGANGTLSGSLVSGQKLTLQSSCTAHAIRAIATDVTNGGTILLKSSCGSPAGFSSPNAAPVLTNNGTITADAKTGGVRQLDVSTTNFGTVNVNTTLDAVEARTFTNDGTVNVATGQTFNWENGDFTNASGAAIAVTGTGQLTMSGGTYHVSDGAATGAGRIVVDDGTVDFNGSSSPAASTVWAHGSGVVTGTIQAGQTFEIEGTCAENATETTNAATFTNNGSVYLTSSCASSVTLDATGRTFVNGGLFSSTAGAGGARTIDGTVVNNHAFGVASALTHNGATFESDASSSLLAVNVSSATAFGAVTSTGGFKLGGELAILVDSGYTPPSGQEFAILNGASPRVGTFATVLSNGPSFSVVYLTTGAKLHTV